MKIFASQKTREIDAYTIKNEPIASIDLMERAAGALFGYLHNEMGHNHKIKFFCGPGNNGGDGLAVARMLAEAEFMADVYTVEFNRKKSKDFSINLERLKEKGMVKIKGIKSVKDFPEIKKGDIVIDAIFGSGLSKPLSEDYAKLVQHINKSAVEVIAIDIPSGLFAEDNTGNEHNNIIRAGTTLSLQFPKLAFMFAENDIAVGNWHIIPIGLDKKAIDNEKTDNYLITKENISTFRKKRHKFDHKGTYGHALLISGCHGRMGAAVLASKATLRAGTGLLTTHVPAKGIGILQATVPEAMLSTDQSDIIFSEAPPLDEYNAIGVGPALGCRSNSQKGLLDLLKKANKAKKPIVIDADGLNIIANNRGYIKEIPKNSILTPHPKEFDRLAGKSSSGYERYRKQLAFTAKHKLIVVLKGAHTSITLPEGTCMFNSTGNPGMATAGSGDVLTGIILGLLAQGYKSEESAILGVYLHGFAGDLAAKEMGHEALIASDITEKLGEVFRDLPA